jgi:dsDNA-binding SOS-regulon protein
MAVLVKYVVIRNGKEDMTFSTKKEADAYDRMLDIAEGLYHFLHTAEVDIADEKLDDLAFFMAKHREQLAKLLKGGKPDASEAKAKEAAADRPPVQEAQAETEAKPSRAAKPKSVAA